MQAALSMTRGAGGFSISPTLTFSYVVPSGSGAFKLLDFDSTFCRDLALNKISPADIRAEFEIRTQGILRLYQEGQSSPSDVDENGNTVMHVSFP